MRTDDSSLFARFHVTQQMIDDDETKIVPSRVAQSLVSGKRYKYTKALQDETRLAKNGKKHRFEINRRDFNVGGGSMIMSKKVKIHVQFTGTR